MCLFYLREYRENIGVGIIKELFLRTHTEVELPEAAEIRRVLCVASWWITFLPEFEEFEITTTMYFYVMNGLVGIGWVCHWKVEAGGSPCNIIFCG